MVETFTRSEDDQRTVRDRIARLRARAKRIKEDGGVGDVTGVLLGILDLLGDEL